MKLTQCIVTKIAHDVAGCSGAVLNTAELLTIDPDGAVEAVKLLGDSAEALVMRMKFFRCLFGTDTDIPADVGARYLATLSQKIVLKGKPKTAAELALVWMGGEFLIKGGTVELSGGKMTASGDMVRVGSEVQDIFKGKEVGITPHNCIFFWIQQLAAAVGKKMTINIMDKCAQVQIG